MKANEWMSLKTTSTPILPDEGYYTLEGHSLCSSLVNCFAVLFWHFKSLKCLEKTAKLAGLFCSLLAFLLFKQQWTTPKSHYQKPCVQIILPWSSIISTAILITAPYAVPRIPIADLCPLSCSNLGRNGMYKSKCIFYFCTGQNVAYYFFSVQIIDEK